MDDFKAIIVHRSISEWPYHTMGDPYAYWITSIHDDSAQTNRCTRMLALSNRRVSGSPACWNVIKVVGLGFFVSHVLAAPASFVLQLFIPAHIRLRTSKQLDVISRT